MPALRILTGMTTLNKTITFGFVLLLAACHRDNQRPDPSSGTVFRRQADAVLVEEAFMTELNRADEIDSVAAWVAPEGATWLISTAKASHQLVVFDGSNGKLLRRVGERGEAPGRFNRPNGIAVYGDLLFVIERDNHRVQVLRLPDFTPLATFGENELRSPYGLWLNPIDSETLELFVTDSFMADYKTELVPPLTELDQRVKRYRLSLDGDAISAQLKQHFGDTSEVGALRMVESIAGDVTHDRLLIAEEDTRVGTTLRVYTLAGDYTGIDMPSKRFKAQAEGVVLWACDDGSGYWLAADQSTQNTVFHVFDRASLDYRGSFAGRTVALTDGIVLHRAVSTRFPAGALFAAHDDQGVGAFDWRDIARTLKLREHCGN